MSNAGLKELSPPGEVRLHHFGFVLNSIQDSAESFSRSLGATWDGNIAFDPIQKVRVTFLKGAHTHDSLIELVEPAGPESPVTRFLKGRWRWPAPSVLRGGRPGTASRLLQICWYLCNSSTCTCRGI
jgi:hypothetical protein